MKKYIHSLMALVTVLSFASCSSDDNETMDNTDNTEVMTFTATQEGTGTRAAINPHDKTEIVWEEGDKISVITGHYPATFTLREGAGTASAKFEGSTMSANSYLAVYPYIDNYDVLYSEDYIDRITFPANQTATPNGFDKNAAFMMAKSENTTLNFKNAVGYIKVTPLFDCSKIELKAANETYALAGTGTLSYNYGEPSISIPNSATDKSYTITLNGNIESGNTYYIAVPSVTLTAGWTLSFTTSDGSKVYTRKGSKEIWIKRNTVINLGKFATDGNYGNDEARGIVRADQEVDMGLTITKDGKNYKVIFAKSNLTATGLAENESYFGDYFARGALEPWYTSIATTSSSVTVNAWKDDKSEGYSYGNCPSYQNNSYVENDVLKIDYDAARQVLGGDWQLPTKEIWKALSDANKTLVYWGADGEKELEYIDGIQGMKITKKEDNSTYLFLPAAGYLINTMSNDVGSYGYYWSGTAHSDYALCLNFCTGYFYAQGVYQRLYGYPIRPIRLVAVE